LNLIDELTEIRGNSNRECMAQGGANIITGLLSGMRGCAMIGQSISNIKVVVVNDCLELQPLFTY
tara:strand:+ start:578 stop:772 length:195 start_codon:yes stop_codon:yes gene_type:complete